MAVVSTSRSKAMDFAPVAELCGDRLRATVAAKTCMGADLRHESDLLRSLALGRAEAVRSGERDDLSTLRHVARSRSTAALWEQSFPKDRTRWNQIKMAPTRAVER